MLHLLQRLLPEDGITHDWRDVKGHELNAICEEARALLARLSGVSR